MEVVEIKDENSYMEIGGDKTSIVSASAYFQELGKSNGMATDKALKLRFALEELFDFIFSFLKIEEEDMGRIKIWSSFEKDALCLVIHEWGIPIIAEEIPDTTIEDLFDNNYQLPSFLDRPGTEYNGFGLHFIKQLTDEFSMLYSHEYKCYEISIKQYFTKSETRLVPVLPKVTEPLLPVSSDEESIDMGNGYIFKRLDSIKEAIQVIRGTIETYGYGVQNYNLPTDINNYLSIINKGVYFPYIVIGEDGIVIHHFAYHQCSYNSNYIEACHQFARPRLRGKVNPMRVMSAVSHLPLIQKFEGLYAFCVTMHIMTQVGAIRNGYHITGFNFYKSHIKLSSVHRDSPDFWCLVETHKTIHPRDRKLYVPSKYQELVKSIYAELELPVTFKENDGMPCECACETNFIVETDEEFCRSLILLHPNKNDWNSICREVVKARIERVPVLRISISTEEPDCMELANRMVELDFVFTGISPINDMLVFHYFNGINIDFEQIKLVKDYGRPLLESIKREYDRIFLL